MPKGGKYSMFSANRDNCGKYLKAQLGPRSYTCLMLEQIQRHCVRIVIGVAFFLFGFFITANALTLTDREIAVGLLAGFIGGLTMLVAVVWQERTARATMALVRTAAP